MPDVVFLDNPTDEAKESGKFHAKKKIMPGPKCKNGRGVTAGEVTEERKGG